MKESRLEQEKCKNRGKTGVCKILQPLRNEAFPEKMGSFMLWWFEAVSQLRNESHCAAKWHSCAKIDFATAKYPTEWNFGCEMISQRMVAFAETC